jgi:hypothetical protein
VLLLERGSLVIATTNSPKGRIAEHLEVSLSEGPCTDCVRSGAHVLVPDLSLETDRYPAFAPQALDAGIRGIHALPLSARSDLVGSVDIVTSELRVLTAHEIGIAEMLCDVAVSYLISVRAHEQANELATQLQHALDSRVYIEQAKGILAERHGISLDDAFERIRQHARSNNARVRDVAEAIGKGGLDL